MHRSQMPRGPCGIAQTRTKLPQPSGTQAWMTASAHDASHSPIIVTIREGGCGIRVRISISSAGELSGVMRVWRCCAAQLSRNRSGDFGAG